jgi:type 1 fimbria pilin
MKKGLITALAALVLLALSSGPTQAQAGRVTLSFSITVTGTPCANATFFGVVGIPDSEFAAIELTDPDGDGVYSGTTQVPPGDPYGIVLVQGTGTIDSPTSSNPFPGPPITVLRDFGVVTPTADQAFAATVNGCPTLPGTGVDTSTPLTWGLAALAVLATGTVLRRRMGTQH